MLFDAFGKKKFKYSVIVAMAAQDTIQTMTAYDLAMLTAFMGYHHPEIGMALNVSKGTIIPEQRHDLVRQALAVEGATHIMWIDSDMRFPRDIILKLLAHEKAIVGCNYATRRHPIIPTATTGDGGLTAAFLYSDPADTDLVPVFRMGMGMMLVDLNVFRQIEAPWFAVGYNKARDGYGGEDVFFCHTIRQHGFEALVDPKASQEIKHCGEFEYSLVHAEVTLRHFQEQQMAKAGETMRQFNEQTAEKE